MAAASLAVQLHAAARERDEAHSVSILSSFRLASHASVAAVSAHEQLSDRREAAGLEGLRRR